MRKKLFWLTAIFAVGFVFRLWFVHTYPQELVFDQEQYRQLAIDLINFPGWAHTFRTYGYSLIIAILYKIFGIGDTVSWQVLQCLMDAASGVILFFIVNTFIKKKLTSWLAYIFYEVNLFTISFVGLLLTEVSTIFFTLLVFFLLLLFLEKKKIRYLLLLGISLGWLPQIRTPFYYFSLFIFIVIIFLIIKWINIGKVKKALIIMMFSLMFSIPFYYNFYGNYVWHKEISPLIVDDQFTENLYMSLYMERIMPIPEYSLIPPQVQTVYGEYSVQKSKAGRQSMANKYRRLAIEKIKEDPEKFVKTRFLKMWYVWEKHFLFQYKAVPESMAGRFAVYWINIVLLISALGGYIMVLKKTVLSAETENKIYLGLITIFALYITLLSSFTPSEERYSLPFYPFLFMFSAYFINILLIKFFKRKKR